MTSFWSHWIIWLTVITLIGVTWLLFANRKIEARGGKEPGTTGHVYDGIEEYDNPLPAWWFNLFVLTIVFGVGYLLLMPGLGNFKGLLHWTSLKQWENEVAAAEAQFSEQFARYRDMDPQQLASDGPAMKMAQRIFANNCSTCHGADARGSFGFPNLTDGDWLYGGAPEQIRQTIASGRQAAMPAWSMLSDQQVQDVADYVVGLSEAKDNPAGQQVYATYCGSCHGAGGEGNPMLGAPRLNDKIWLYGGNKGQVMHSIRTGRNGQMPAHKDTLSEEKIQLLTAYVLSLSR